jgi:hypothetical protein
MVSYFLSAMCVLYIIFIPHPGFYVLLSFHAACSTRMLLSSHIVCCVSPLFHNVHVLCNIYNSTLCVVSILFVPRYVCYVVPLFHGIKVTHRTNLHSILCLSLYAVCPVCFFYSMLRAMHYILVLHGMCTIRYFYSEPGLSHIIFCPMLCVLSCTFNICSVMLCVTSIPCCMCCYFYSTPCVCVCAACYFSSILCALYFTFTCNLTFTL